MTKLAIIIPDRRDRPALLENCKRMMAAQSIRGEIYIVDGPAKNNEVDITARYRRGYEWASNKKFDLIAFVENDDWYAPNYLETMIKGWNENGQPDIFGTNSTIYYHIYLRAWFTMNHITRSSAMSTLIKTNLNIQWPVDNDPYTDIALYAQIKNKIIWNPPQIICMGIKHGIGMCGGYNHTNKLHRYKNQDKDFTFLKSILDPESFEFYSAIAPSLP